MFNSGIYRLLFTCMNIFLRCFYLIVDGNIILKWIFNSWGGSMDWIDLDQDGDRWRALVNAVMNLRVP